MRWLMQRWEQWDIHTEGRWVTKGTTDDPKVASAYGDHDPLGKEVGFYRVIACPPQLVEELRRTCRWSGGKNSKYAEHCGECERCRAADAVEALQALWDNVGDLANSAVQAKVRRALEDTKEERDED